jgi:hypothetical protein
MRARLPKSLLSAFYVAVVLNAMALAGSAIARVPLGEANIKGAQSKGGTLRTLKETEESTPSAEDGAATTETEAEPDQDAAEESSEASSNEAPPPVHGENYSITYRKPPN